MSNRFAVSDLHFDDARIIELCNRPFASKQEMNEQMVMRWNSVVSSDDTVFFGGDFMFAKKDKWFNLLNGKKVLLVGNHDHSATTGLAWKSVHDRLEVTHNDKMLVLDHYPLEDWHGKFKGSLHLFGHVHNIPVSEIKNRFCMCAEFHDYTPRNLDHFTAMARPV